MRIELTFGHYQHFQVEPLRMRQLLDQDYAVATAMGIKDTIADYFRTEKKSIALASLHELLSNAQVINERLESVVFPYALTAFNTLMSFAEIHYQDKFHIAFNTEEKKIIFSIENDVIKTLDFSDALDSIYINGKHFLNNYDDILAAHAVLCDRLLGDRRERFGDEEQCDDIASAIYFYRTHPQLKALLLQCHAHDGDNMRAIIDELITRGRIQTGRQGHVNADAVARHLSISPSLSSLNENR